MENKQKDNNNTKEKKDEYTVIRKFNNEGESFQKVMEKILIRRLGNI